MERDTIVRFFIELGKMFESSEQEIRNENQTLIYKIAKLYLKSNNMTINELEEIIDTKEVQDKYEDIDEVTLLLHYIKWKESVK